ncbi:DUF4197 domain-containing protein [Sulfurimonas sp.]|uniref:DUF4197 domain-containing protein n=1 Tax=Sulfurimonas sp. TaxID=2022749 RepID=UPI002B4706DA|nr:DUF4197 domain-containing protein [Sulfurimonas sp.]
MLNKFILVLFFCSSVLFSFDFGSFMSDVVKSVSEPTTSFSSKSTLSSDTISNGLKEALNVGAKYAVKELGKKDGYLSNASVKIPLPKSIKKAKDIIRGFGGDKYVDDFIKSMNSAATDAAPKTIGIFLHAIQKMTIDDARTILSGNEDGATEYFKTHTTNSLTKLILPIIKKTMETNNVTAYYKKANSFYKSDIKSRAVEYGIGSFLPKENDENLDEYVTSKAIEGLFKIIAQKETEIRKDPLAQTTSLLKKVFGN